MQATEWMPGAERLACSAPGGQLIGGPPRTVWHTTESGDGDAAFGGVARYLREKGFEPHLLWDPSTGRVGQFMPATQSARALMRGVDPTNRMGTVCIQIEVLARAAHPFTDGPMKGRAELLEWLDSWSIPRVWPSGAPLPYPRSAGANGTRDHKRWVHNRGHYGHSQVPDNLHGDPGGLDVEKLLRESIEPISSDLGDDMPLSDDDVTKILNTEVGRSGMSVATALQRSAEASTALLAFVKANTPQAKS